MRTYTCEAALSPTSTTASPGVTPPLLRVAISRASSRRMAFPIAVPSISSAGNIHRPRLPDDHHLDLPRILQLMLDLPGDVRAQLARVRVVHTVGRDDDAYLPACLDRENLFHPGELRRELLQLGETLDVGLECLAPSPRP